MVIFERARYFINHHFVRKSVLLQAGNIAGTFVQAVAGVVLARLLGPHEFGRYAIVMSMAAVGSVLLGAGAADAMAPVLSRARHSGDDVGVRDAMLFLGKFILITAAIVFVLGFSMPALAERFYNDRMLGWLGFAVLMASAVSTILFTPTQLSLQVFGRIGRLSALTFTDQIVRQSLVVALALAGLGITGASLGHLFGSVIIMIAAAVFWRRLRAQWPLMLSIGSLWGRFPGNGKQFISPTLWVLADRNLAMLYSAAPVALAALFLTTTDVSYFKIALGWVTLALAVLSPVSVLLNTELARIQVQRPLDLRTRFAQITGIAVAASAFVTGIAALIARPVFHLLYGARYADAVPLVYWLVPFGALFGLGIALGPMWRAIGRVRVSIAINLCVLGIGIPLALLAMRQWGVLGAVAMVTGWYTASHLASFVYLMKTLGGEQKIGARE